MSAKALSARLLNDTASRKDGVRGLQPDMEDVVRPEVPVHNPRLMCGEFALDGCPLVARRRGQARPPEEIVQLHHGAAGDLTQADREGRVARRARARDYHPLHICIWC